MKSLKNNPEENSSLAHKGINVFVPVRIPEADPGRKNFLRNHFRAVGKIPRKNF